MKDITRDDNKDEIINEIRDVLISYNIRNIISDVISTQ